MNKSSMFDLQVDLRQGGLTRLPVRVLEKNMDGNFPFMIVPEVESLYYVVKMLLHLKLPVLLTGASGVGKTAFLQAVVGPKLCHTRIPMMENGETKWFQTHLENNLHGPKKDNVWFFIDDLHLPSPQLGSKTTVIWDLLRQIMSFKMYHSTNSFIAKKTANVKFLAAASLISKTDSGLSSGLKGVLPSKLTRLFNVLHMVVPSPDSLFAQYFKPVHEWILQFPNYAVPYSTELACSIVEGLVTLHSKVEKYLRISPSKGYYFYTLHDIPKVLNGMFLMIPKKDNALAAVKLPPMSNIADVALHAKDRSTDLSRIDDDEDEKELSDSETSSEEEAEEEKSSKNRKTSNERRMDKNDRKPLQKFVKSKENLAKPKGTEQKETDYVERAGGTNDLSAKEEESTESHDDSTALASAAQKQVGKAVSWMEAQEVAAHLLELVRTVVRLWGHECFRVYADRLLSSSDRCWFQTTLTSIIQRNFCSEQETCHSVSMSFCKGDVYSRYSGLLLFGITEAYSQPLYHGPLISYEELMDQDKEVSFGIFTSHLMKSVYQRSAMPPFSGYIEYQRNQVQAGLVLLLNEFNTATNQDLGIVFFSDMIHHIARLSRVLQLPQGHSILIGQGSKLGRSTCIKLAGYAASMKVYTMKLNMSYQKTVSQFKAMVIEASKAAGIEKQRVIIEIEDIENDKHQYFLQSAAQLMKEGFTTDIYDSEEMTKIAKLKDPHRPRLSWNPMVVQRVFQTYLTDVKRNMHIIVSLSETRSSKMFIKQHQSYTNLFKLAKSIDVFEQWSLGNYKDVAEAWLRSSEVQQCISWHPLKSDEQISSVAHALACCHMYMGIIYKNHFPDRTKFVSPKTFHEYLNAFTVITYSIQTNVRSNFDQYAGALEKVHETFTTIAEYTDRLIKLIPMHRDQTQTVRKKKLAVDEAAEALRNSQDILKAQEQKVEAMMKPLEEKEQKTMSEFAKANPVYDAALKAVQTLTVASIDEIRSYRNPPNLVKKVVQMLTILFNMSPTWESSKQLLLSEGFFDMLLYFDKENISDSVYKKLTRFCDDPETSPESVAKCSIAAMAMCQWIHAVHVYHTVYRKITPMMHSLDQAKEELNEVIWKVQP